MVGLYDFDLNLLNKIIVYFLNRLKTVFKSLFIIILLVIYANFQTDELIIQALVLHLLSKSLVLRRRSSFIFDYLSVKIINPLVFSFFFLVTYFT